MLLKPGALVLTYTAAAGMAVGAQVEITVPAGWTPAPFTPFGEGGTAAGEVRLSATSDGLDATVIDGPEVTPTLSILDRKLTATLRSTLGKDGTLVFTYHQAKAPKTLGASVFSVKAKSSKDGRLTALAEAAPTIEVVAGHGSGTIALTHGGKPFRKATKDTEYRRLVFTYTADGRLAKGARIQITVPSDLGELRADNKDGVDDLWRGNAVRYGQSKSQFDRVKTRWLLPLTLS